MNVIKSVLLFVWRMLPKFTKQVIYVNRHGQVIYSHPFNVSALYSFLPLWVCFEAVDRRLVGIFSAFGINIAYRIIWSEDWH